MKFRYSKFNGFDVSSINLGELMDSMSDALLDSGYDDDYYWTRQQRQNDTSLDALRRALLQALMDQGLVKEVYLTLHKQQPQQTARKNRRPGPGEFSEPLPRNVRFEVTEKGLDF